MIEITTTKSGIKILYDPDSRKFIARNKEGEEIYKDDTQEQVEEYLKKFEKRSFQKIRAVHSFSRSAAIGHITSISREHSSYRGFYFEAWFVNEEDKTRSKHTLSSFFQATPENIKRAEEIMKLQKQILAKYKLIERLQQKFKEPLTEKNVLTLAGVEA